MKWQSDWSHSLFQAAEHKCKEPQGNITNGCADRMRVMLRTKENLGMSEDFKVFEFCTILPLISWSRT